MLLGRSLADHDSKSRNGDTAMAEGAGEAAMSWIQVAVFPMS
jgi:hypothetical protein